MRLTEAIVAVVCVAVFATAAPAQRFGGVQGGIVDEGTGAPLAFVNVSVRGGVSGAITNRAGEFHIPGVAVGPRTIVASMMGYKTLTMDVVIEPDRTATVDFALTETPLEMEEVVVTGTRTSRYVKDVPVRTQVMTRQSIKDAGASDIYEALEGTPGVRVEQQCQFCNYSQIRLQGLGPDHTQVLVDGQPVYSGLAGVYGLQQVGTASLDRIEIVKGAGSAVYGSGAIAGAVNLVTRTPRSRPEAGLTLEFGEYGTQRYDFSASQQFGSAGLVLFAQKNKGDAIDQTRDGFGRDEVLGPDYTSDRVRSNLTSAGFNAIFDEVSGMDRVVVRGRALHEVRQGGELYNEEYVSPEDIYENPFTAGSERITTDRYETEVSLSRGFDAGNGLDISLAYATHDRNATNDTFAGDYESIHGEPPPVDLLRPYLATEDLVSASLMYSHPAPSRHRFLVGTQLTHDRFEESGMYVVVDEEDENHGQVYRSTSEKRATDIGLYAQDEFVASDELEFVFGLRFDHHSSEDAFRGSGSVAPEGIPSVKYEESSVNPRVAVRYSPGERLAFRGSVGTGFRVPFGFSEELHLCSGSPRVWKGDGLKPERSVSYGVSADYYGERWTLGASLYRTDIRDKIGLVDASEIADARGYTYEWENIDDAFVQGIELDARHEVTAALALNAYATLAQGRYDSAREDWVGTEHEDESVHISRLPKYSAGLGVEYHPARWRVVVDANLQGPLYIDYFADGEEPTKIKETETFVIVNTKVSREMTGGVELFAGARNLTDYVQEEKHTDDAAFMYAPVYGRIFYGGIAFGF